MLFSGCSEWNGCGKYKDEEYPINHAQKVDSLFLKTEPFRFKFKKVDLRKINFESYRLTYGHSLNSELQVLEIQKRENSYKMIFEEFEYRGTENEVKLKNRKEFHITEFDWLHFEYLIYKYEFWTAELEINNLVADGGGYSLEGIRPNAENCNKCANKIIIRGAPTVADKIGWLCEDFMYYGYRLTEGKE